MTTATKLLVATRSSDKELMLVLMIPEIAKAARCSLDSTIRTLAKAAHPKSKVDGEGDAETRRNAIHALAKCVSTVVRSTLFPQSEATEKLAEVFSPVL